MKTILYLAQSLNGYIAKDNGDTSWIGSADLKRLREMTTKAGNVVMGRNTYEQMLADEQFPLKDRLNVVMTREIKSSGEKNVVFTDMSPGKVVEFLRDQNFEQVMVIGGGKIARSFLAQRLVDELYVTIEPLLLGRGVSFIDQREFMEEENLEVELELLETIPISAQEIQLHYRVKKSQILESSEGRESEAFLRRGLVK